ncbi:hypothetical protein ABTY61_37565 [Kitasatospora sp. NPDC096128]|uniref:hypothetical protein n=1 Tax=Kitasatospora sp. NPDC096128 TaxID=3155547 RepID=UPI0033255541
MPDAFDPIFEELASINSEMAALTQRMLDLEQRPVPSAAGPGAGNGAVGGPSDRGPGVPVLWRALTAEQSGVLWPEFVAWVVWLADAYELTTEQLPRQCWWQHAGVVEELTALWTSHASAYASEEDVGASPYLWQDALARAVERINRNWLGGCVNGFHEPRSRMSFTRDKAYAEAIVDVGPPLPESGAADASGLPEAGRS